MAHPTLMGHAALGLGCQGQDLNSVRLTNLHRSAAQSLLKVHATKLNAGTQGQDTRVAWEIMQEDHYFPQGAKAGDGW